MVGDVWINYDMHIFWLPPNTKSPEYLPHTAVTGLHWDVATDNRDLICLEAQLPNGRRVLDLENGGTLELVYSRYGPPEDYENQEAIAFRASLCVTQSREVLDPIVKDVVTADVHLSCRLEILPDE